MVTCNTLDDYKILYSLRAHGWARGINAIKSKKKIGNLNKDFVFINSGFNLSELMYDNKSSEEKEVTGGRKNLRSYRRAGASCARMAGC